MECSPSLAARLLLGSSTSLGLGKNMAWPDLQWLLSIKTARTFYYDVGMLVLVAQCTSRTGPFSVVLKDLSHF